MTEISVPEIIMPAAQMKTLLKLAQQEGQKVPCVVGLDKATEGVILLARNGSPKSVRKALISTVQKQKLGEQIKTDAQSLFFGFASTDVGAEAILKLTLNREPSRAELLTTKLHRRVRTAGFVKVVLNVDPQLDNEGDDAAASASGEPDAGLPPADAGTLYRQRLTALTPALARALKEQIGDTGKIRAVTEFMREKAGAGAFDAALKALDMLEKLLAPPAVPAEADRFDPRRLNALRDEWDTSKETVNRALSALLIEIIDEFDDPESTSAADQLSRILARFNEGLTTTLDAIAQAADGGQRGPLAAKAGRIASMYLAYLGVDPLIAHVENNPYEIDVAINATLSAPLTAIQEEVGTFAVA